MRTQAYDFYHTTPRLSKLVKILIIVQTIFFLLVHLFPRIPLLLWFGLSPTHVCAHGWIWQFVTYMFVHENVWQLVVNMCMLWFFGSVLEQVWGKRIFLSCYLGSGLVAGIASFLVGLYSFQPILGASGALFGILVAFAYLFPQTTLFFLFLFPMNIRQLIFVIAVIEILMAIVSGYSGFIFAAQLFGGIFGYFFVKNQCLQKYSSFFNPLSGIIWLRGKWARYQEIKKEREHEKIDHILDKISQHGIHSLSEKEMNMLKKRNKESIRA